MYDMYPWDSRADGSAAVRMASDAAVAKTAAAAVQEALDRRDNGSDPAEQ